MYQWAYNQGAEMSQLEANSMPCQFFDGICNAPYCGRWHDVTKAYFIKEDGGLGKAEFLELMEAEKLGYCR